MNEWKDSTGRWLTTGLIWEIAISGKENVMFTIKDEPITVEINGKKRKLKSLKKMYMECRDPTEYTFATKCLGGWQHWKRLCSSRHFKPIVEEWREELEVMLKSEGIKAMAALANENDRIAAKWLAEKGWVEKAKGRPSKVEKEKEARIDSAVMDSVMDDLERISIQ